MLTPDDTRQAACRKRGQAKRSALPTNSGRTRFRRCPSDNLDRPFIQCYETQERLRMKHVSMHCACSAIMLFCMVSCSREAPSPAPTAQQTSAPTSGDCGPTEDLARLDPRVPVPLQPTMAWHQKQNMMEHLVAGQGIVEGLGEKEWMLILKA